VKLLGFILHPQAVTLREQEDGLQIINILLTNYSTTENLGHLAGLHARSHSESLGVHHQKTQELDSQSRETKESKILVTIQTRTEDLLFRNNKS
jgi:hypothetical protein